LKGTKWVELEEMDIWTGRRVAALDARDDAMPDKIGVVHRMKNVVGGQNDAVVIV